MANPGGAMNDSAPTPPRSRRKWSRAWRRSTGALILLLFLTACGWLYFRLPGYLGERATRAALEAGHLDAAATHIDRWVRTRPEDARAWYWKARVALDGGDVQTSLESLSRARNLGHPEASTHRLEGLALARSGNGAAAEPLLRQALEGPAGLDPEIARELARIYLNSYQIEAAAVVLDRWAGVAPDDPTPHLWRVEVDRRVRADPEVIIDRYRAALDRDPALDEARIGLADALRSADRLDEATRAYAECLRVDPDSPAALLGLGLVFAEQGDTASAEDHLHRASELDPNDSRALAALATIALRRDDLEGSLAVLDEAIGRAPEDFELHYRRGQILERMGLSDQAAQERAIAGRLQADQERIKELRDKLLRSPLDPEVGFEVASWMLANGHEEEGLRWAEQTARNRPDHVPTCWLLADYYNRRGQADLANYYRFLADSATDGAPTGP